MKRGNEMQGSKYVGRVGGLAIALGIGAAIGVGGACATAWAAPDSVASSNERTGTTAGTTPNTQRTHNASSASKPTVGMGQFAVASQSLASRVRPAAETISRATAAAPRQAQMLRATAQPASTVPPTGSSTSLPTPLALLAGPRHVLSGGDLFLGGNYLELGISSIGSFGTETGKPAEFRGGTPPGSNPNSIGLTYDSDGFGTGSAPALDFYVPDTPEERWSVAFNDNRYAGFSALNGSGGNAADLSYVSLVDRSVGDTLSGKFTATVGGVLQVGQVHTFNVNDTFIRTDVTLTNVSGATLTNVEFMRSFDPDGTRSVGGSNTTTNTIGGQFATEDYTLVNATSLIGDNYNTLTGNLANVFLYARREPNAIAYTGGFANYDPYDFDRLSQSTGYTTTADDAIGLIFKAGNLNPGETAKFSYYTGVTVSADPLSVVKGVAASPTSSMGFSLAGLGSLFNEFLNPEDGVFRKIFDRASTLLDDALIGIPDTPLGRIAGKALSAFGLVTSIIDVVEGPDEAQNGYPLSGSLRWGAGVLGVGAFGLAAVGVLTGVGALAMAPVAAPVVVTAMVLGGAAWFCHDILKI